MITILIILLCVVVYKELIGYLICGPYTNDINSIKKLLENKAHVDLQLSEHMIFVNVDKAYFNKGVDEWLWKWYVSDCNGRRKRIPRWTESSKHLDNIFLQLKTK